MLDIMIYSLFPEMFTGVLGDSIVNRAVEKNLVRIRTVNFRDFAKDKHRTVDDYPFGGGAGMLLKPEPLFEAVESVEKIFSESSAAVQCDAEGNSSESSPVHERVVLLSPQGRTFNQRMAQDFAQGSRLSLICGHYEGFDDRVRQHLATDEVSLGDFVMTGGEIAAMAIVDAVVRLLPGALGNMVSADDDSFSTGLLEYPQYTRPAEFRGMSVPAVLLSGNHQQVDTWRRRHALYRTWVRRPDLLRSVELTEVERDWIRDWERGNLEGIEVPEKETLKDGE